MAALAAPGVRNLAYAALFLTLGLTQPHGVWAMLVIAVLVGELVVTLMDFVEEDVSRKLPATERVTHTLLAINYGAILALLVPVLAGWAGEPSAIVPAWYGIGSVLAPLAALGVIVFGLRDFSQRAAPSGWFSATRPSWSARFPHGSAC